MQSFMRAEVFDIGQMLSNENQSLPKLKDRLPESQALRLRVEPKTACRSVP